MLRDAQVCNENPNKNVHLDCIGTVTWYLQTSDSISELSIYSAPSIKTLHLEKLWQEEYRKEIDSLFIKECMAR